MLDRNRKTVTVQDLDSYNSNFGSLSYEYYIYIYTHTHARARTLFSSCMILLFYPDCGGVTDFASGLIISSDLSDRKNKTRKGFLLVV
jgi:hypothetical protein